MELTNIFQQICSNDNIKKLTNNKTRNRKNGISIIDALLYRFKYSEINITKERNAANINNLNNTIFKRQSFDKKEKNIPLDVYIKLFNGIKTYFNDNLNDINDTKIIGIDGTYNNDTHMNELLNMGFYDISNGIAIDLVSYGKENKNREIKSARNYIKNNMDVFKNNIIVADRAYYSYDFIKFLIDNDLKFIIRVKGEAKNLDINKNLSKSINKYNTIMDIRPCIKIYKYDNILEKTIYVGKSKNKIDKHKIKIKNDCILVHNLSDNIYSKEKVLELYRSRWDIEVFFKHIKYNFKFQHLKEVNVINNQKMYICELIITYIAKIIENAYISTHAKTIANNVTYKINRHQLISGIFDSLLHKLFTNTLTKDAFNKFCALYIKIIMNKKNRNFPRTSKTPFTKWYVKGYSDTTKYLKILDAITNNKVNELNKNLKVIANKIILSAIEKYG